MKLSGIKNLHAIDLISVKLVIACAHEGTLARAADTLHLSLAGASHRLARFESRLGRRIFERHARGVRLTGEGAALLPHAEQLLQAVEKFQSAVVQP